MLRGVHRGSGRAALRGPASWLLSRPRRRRTATAADRSPAGHAHMSGDGGPVVTPIDDEVVALGLAVDGFADRRFERLIPFGLAQRGAQIGCVLLAEAHIESAGAGHPDAIAALAEIMGQGGDEAEPPAGLPHRHIPRRASGAVIAFVE